MVQIDLEFFGTRHNISKSRSTFWGNFQTLLMKKLMDDFNDLFSFCTHAWKNLVRLFLPFGSGSGRGSGARVRVFFSGIARVISAHDRTRGHYYAKAGRVRNNTCYDDEHLEL